jgi:hypothetical protein
VTNQLAKKATSDGSVMIAPIIDPFKNMPFVGRLSLPLSTTV